ncbi:MbnP family protein [Winogradskyella sp. A3E31]|uniref:MbnP family protein n=1 Tax=Winogradskyella sp. A3E31 TaxID=3349637 RepID=UPI00398A75AC
MKKIFALFLAIGMVTLSCSEDADDNSVANSIVTFKFTHNWDGEVVTNTDFNTIKFTNANGEMLSIERLRYLVSDITLTTSQGESLVLDLYSLVDVTEGNNLSFTPLSSIPVGEYSNVSFTFGFDNEDNSENYTDLNSASFNVPEMLGGGYHYMQFDGKFINSNSEEQGFNYHAIRAVDNPGDNPTFPQDTFFRVDLGPVTIASDTEIEVKMNISEWFKNPNLWDLNQLNSVLMPNSSAQIMMSENGRNVFSIGTIIQ